LSLNQTAAIKFISSHAKPEAISDGDLQVIQDWMEEYPYCQSLHFLAAKAATNSPSYPKILTQAATISPSRAILQSFIYHPDLFIQQEELNKEEMMEITAAGIAYISEEIEEITDTIPFEPLAIEEEEMEFEHTEEPYLIDVIASEIKTEAVEESVLQQTETAQSAQNTAENLSTYHDESLPYTFLWWLNKTRKEHATNLQPYVSFKLDTSKEIRKIESEILNHQIAENIFHLKGVDDISQIRENTTVPFNFRKKEYQIIEKFIKEEPQIKPPIASKIDAENKAKRSSEDENQVVSETLAKIYVEQMLYHKALDAYKKLSLKFPEKSAYFASQIKYLELKVN